MIPTDRLQRADVQKIRIEIELRGRSWPIVSVKEVLNVPNRNVRFTPERGRLVWHKKTRTRRGFESVNDCWLGGVARH